MTKKVCTTKLDRIEVVDDDGKWRSADDIRGAHLAQTLKDGGLRVSRYGARSIDFVFGAWREVAQ